MRGIGNVYVHVFKIYNMYMYMHSEVKLPITICKKILTLYMYMHGYTSSVPTHLYWPWRSVTVCITSPPSSRTEIDTPSRGAGPTFPDKMTPGLPSNRGTRSGHTEHIHRHVQKGQLVNMIVMGHSVDCIHMYIDMRYRNFITTFRDRKSSLCWDKE